jgi:lysophospholipase L1-like esterase
MCIACHSCNEDNDRELWFFGDSLIAKWNLDESFPSWRTYNYGISGSGINSLKEKSGFCKNRQIVILIGTNDLSYIRNDVDSYLTNYLQTIRDMGADRIFLISLLPRGDENGKWQNDVIKDFNNRVKVAISDDPLFVYLDLNEKLASTEGRMNDNYSYDGLHLNSYGYEILSAALEKVVK